MLGVWKCIKRKNLLWKKIKIRLYIPLNLINSSICIDGCFMEDQICLELVEYLKKVMN